MPLDFDIKAFLEHIQGLKPPYECPINSCGRVYKSFSGMNYHLLNFDHDNPENNSPSRCSTPASRKKGHWRKGNQQRAQTPEVVKTETRDPLSYADAQRVVEVDFNGRIHRLNIYEPLEIVPHIEEDNVENVEKEEEKKKILSATPGKGKPKGKVKKDSLLNNVLLDKTESKANTLPVALFKVISEAPKRKKAPARPNSYFRYIEKTAEELDEEIEYDMDEEDYAWLELINTQRKKENLPLVTQENFELLMDRFEKEAFFQCQNTGKDLSPHIDDDAVCAICMDGECANSNVILFCDMCNLAVHQECYGVPYIPEGQWLCRRCLQSPSRAVDCCLCPNKGGAFKQTDDGRWAHVVCALWIPEIGFANTVFLEPIDNIERIPAARWKLTCYICKHRGSGACIQCHRSSCYTAFHVTCAQQAGLFMKIEAVREPKVNGTAMSIRKTAFCDVHTPSNMNFHPMIDNGVSSDEESQSNITPAEAKAQSRQKMRKARKELAEKRNAVPVVSVPTISPKKMNNISNRVTLRKKEQFISKLLSYWTLKRQSRNGVPLLRRLQSCHMSRNKEMGPSDKESAALREQLKYWQKLRQDLERARLLVELIRKREKLKREQIRIQQQCLELQLTPLLVLLRQTLEHLAELDNLAIFLEPVDAKEVPEYYNIILNPMDLRTMREKVENHLYTNIEQFEADFNLIWTNCLKFNGKDTPFYRAGCKLRDQGGAIVRAVRRSATKIGYDEETGLHTDHQPAPAEPMILDDEILLSADGRRNLPLEEQLKLLLDRLDEANAAHPHRKPRLAKLLSKEIAKVRRQLNAGETSQESDQEVNQSVVSCASDDDGSKTEKPASKVTKDDKTTVAESNNSSSKDEKTPKKQSVPRRKMSEKSELCVREKSASSTENIQSLPQNSKAKVQSPIGGKSSELANKKKKIPEVQDQPQKRRAIDACAVSPIPQNKDSFQHYRQHGEDSEADSSNYSSDGQSDSSKDDESSSSSSDEQTDERSTIATERKASIGPPEKKQKIAASTAVAKYAQSSKAKTAAEKTKKSRNRCGKRFHEDSSQPSILQYLQGGKTPSKDDSLEELEGLEALDLVWAKCRGYPWYPALVVNPKMPKSGYYQNGVPIPVPPDEVLALQKRHETPVYLVLFFDTKRTWQWLPRSKLEPLGADAGKDKTKLLENKKPSVRRAVRKAYQAAMNHRCKVTGETNPLSPISITSEGET